MLFATPTPAGAGATLWGNLHDLHHLHETIHYLADSAPFVESVTEVVLGLAYDIRHAFMGDRETKALDVNGYGEEVCRGENVLWPILFFQVSLLRSFAAYAPTTRAIHADLYRLEAAIEMALHEAEPSVATRCMRWLNTPFPIGNDYYSEIMYEAARKFALISRTKQRLKQLPIILDNLLPFSTYYKNLAKQIEAEATRLECDPHLIEFSPVWPEFRW